MRKTCGWYVGEGSWTSVALRVAWCPLSNSKRARGTVDAKRQRSDMVSRKKHREEGMWNHHPVHPKHDENDKRIEVTDYPADRKLEYSNKAELRNVISEMRRAWKQILGLREVRRKDDGSITSDGVNSGGSEHHRAVVLLLVERTDADSIKRHGDGIWLTN